MPPHDFAAVDAALARGFRVFPAAIHSREPALPRSWKELATSDKTTTRKLWTDALGEFIEYNVAVACGNGLFVVDVDVKDGKEGDASFADLCKRFSLPETYTVRTPSGGRHLYFSTQEDLHGGKDALYPGIDFRGIGGYVVGAGSQLENGAYVVELDVPISPLPADAVDYFRREDTPEYVHEPEAVDDPVDVQRAREWVLNSAPTIGTFSVAAKLRTYGLSQGKCRELVYEWNEKRREVPREREHLDFRIRNAFAYSKAPRTGNSVVSAFEAIEPSVFTWKETTKAAENSFRKRLVRIDWSPEMQGLPYKEPLIEGLLFQRDMYALIGKSNAGKTHIAIDLACSVASAMSWNGHDVAPGLVIYVAAEGVEGVRERLEGQWARRRTSLPGPVHLRLLGGRPDLRSYDPKSGDFQALMDEIHQAQEDHGKRCSLVIVDTYNKSTLGMNENDPKDVGNFLRGMIALQEEFQTGVMIIHHEGKSSAGARGHSSLNGAVDTEITVTPSEIKITKQRDQGKIASVPWHLQDIEFVSSDGEVKKVALPHYGRRARDETPLSHAARELRDAA